jgi:hypothetical protein
MVGEYVISRTTSNITATASDLYGAEKNKNRRTKHGGNCDEREL